MFRIVGVADAGVKGRGLGLSPYWLVLCPQAVIYGGVMGLNCAPTSTGGTSTQAPRLTVQVPVPVHAPLQPANVYPEAAAAVRITSPALKLAVHVVPVPALVQLMPPGAEVTIPPSPPA